MRSRLWVYGQFYCFQLLEIERRGLLVDHSEPQVSGQVLVFLPAAAAQMIVTKLEEHGHFAIAVESIAELESALRLHSLSLAITTRADIDVVRNIRPIPVVNLEVFFHTINLQDGSMTASKQFDGDAFIKRVALLKEPRLER